MNATEIKKVKTAIVGCGMISNIYIHNLKNLFHVVDLVAISDINREAANEKAKTYGISRVMSIDEVAADPEIEMVVCLTPAPVHYSVLKQMLNAGKNVYTEKMFTTDIEQSRELVALAEEKGLQIVVAPDTVLGASFQTARHIIDMGLVGTVNSGVISVTRSHLLASELYRFLQLNGGALPYDIGVYYIGSLVALLGAVKSIRAFGAPAYEHTQQLLFQEQKSSVWTIPGNNVIAAALEFENGALVTMHFNGNTVGVEGFCYELYGTRGMLKLGNPDHFGDEVKLVLPENSEVSFPMTHGYDGRNMLEPFAFDFYGHRGIGVAEACYAIRAGRKARLSGDYGLHCQEVLYGLDEAARTGSTYQMTSHAEIRPLTPGYYSSMYGGTARADAELSLVD